MAQTYTWAYQFTGLPISAPASVWNVKGALVAAGTTNEFGSLEVTLPEGQYVAENAAGSQLIGPVSRASASGGSGGGVVVEIRSCIVDDGITDNSAVLTAMFGIVRPYPATYHLSSGLPVVLGAQVSGIPSGSTILGDGCQQSVFHIVGVDVLNAGTNYDAFRIADTAHDITFQGLGFTGENNPYSTPQAKNQSNVIRALGTTGVPTDITVKNCSFRNLFGFSIHNDGTGLRWNMIDNVLVDLGSGVNVNGDMCNFTGNTLDRAWGIEASGSKITITNNWIIHCQATGGGISIGGSTSVGAVRPGGIVTGNHIYDGNGMGISITEASFGTLVTHNYMRCLARGGASILGTINPPAWVKFHSNMILSCGAYGASTGFTALQLGVASRTDVRGNTIADEALAVTTVTDGAITASSRQFTTTQVTFNATWLYCPVTIVGAGSAAVPFVSVIESIVDTHNVILAYPASTTVTGATAYLNGYQQRYGITSVSGTTDLTVADNVLSNISKDMECNATTGVLFRNNTYTPANISLTNGAVLSTAGDTMSDLVIRATASRPPVMSQPVSAGNFTVATGAALNGGTAVRNTGSDTCGQINYTVVAGATAGTLFTVTFGLALTGTKIYVVPIFTDAVSAVAGIYISATSTTGFTVKCANAHAATAATGFQFSVTQSS
jgi:hypothetical protein